MEVGVEFVQTWLALSAEMGDSLGFRTSMEDFSQASGAGIGIYIFTDQIDCNGFRRLIWQNIIQEEISRGLWYPHKAIGSENIFDQRENTSERSSHPAPEMRSTIQKIGPNKHKNQRKC